MTVDLNAVRAARRETLGKGPEVIIGEKTFQCPADMPFDALVAGNRAEGGDAEATYEFVGELLGDKGLTALREWRPSLHEMKALVKGVLDEYGQSRGSEDGDVTDGGSDGDSGEARG